MIIFMINLVDFSCISMLTLIQELMSKIFQILDTINLMNVLVFQFHELIVSAV